jgi:putative transcriptional regulator
MARGTHAGQLLVAAPTIGDPRFERTVILVLEDEAIGSLGLVLNRPSDLAVADPLPDWLDLAAEPSVVFAGGPVEPEAAIGLGLARPGWEDEPAAADWHPLDGGIGTLDLSRPPSEAAAPLERVRVFAGYAGWGPGQLAEEVQDEAWIVLPPRPDDVFGDTPEVLWSAVLRRQGGALALLSTHPRDPSLN